MFKRIILILLAVTLILGSTTACGLVQQLQGEETTTDSALQGSGTVEAVQVLVAAQVGGRVAEVSVRRGETVEAGAPLFRLEDDLLQAQRNQALASVDSARANLDVARSSLDSAQAGLDSAHIQYDLELYAARLADQPKRRAAWSQSQPDEFSLPGWYFDKSEEMSAAQAEMRAAQAELDTERQNLETVIAAAGGAALQEAVERLATVEAAFRVAQDVLERASAGDDQDLQDEAQAEFDKIESELKAAQTDYDELLTDEDSQDILRARARLALSQERYQAALDRYNQFLTGEDSLRLRAASAAVRSAEVGMEQVRAQVRYAETAVKGAQAQLDLIDVQIEKLTVMAPVSGVVIARNIEPGEVVQPGATSITLGQLDDLTITVYIPEDRYGEINLGMQAEVVVDSFPGETFQAEVVRIADQAEFTPRNVQTEEGRRTTVFAVELSVQDPGGRLKPGMPADVTFQE
jgi:multidrug resistance efflux pump